MHEYEFHFVRNGNLIHDCTLSSAKKEVFKKQLLKALEKLNLVRDYSANCEAYMNDKIYLSFRRIA